MRLVELLGPEQLYNDAEYHAVCASVDPCCPNENCPNNTQIADGGGVKNNAVYEFQCNICGVTWIVKYECPKYG